MTGFAVVFYDGKRAGERPARLSVGADGNLRLELDGSERRYAVATAEIGDRIGALGTRVIAFPDGASVHVPPDEAADRALDALGRGGGALRRLEARWPAALAAFAASAVLIAALLRWGLPAVAGMAVARVPLTAELRLGEETLGEMDEHWLGPSRLPAARRASLGDRFARDIAAPAGFGLPIRLEFRRGGAIGANAFALPGGIVVVTDELVGIAENDEEVLIVLAHETGHVVGRHALRQGVESLGIAAIMSGVTGDLSGLASLGAALPVILMRSGYSRRDERAADAYAFAWSDAHAVPRTRMTDLIGRIEAREGGSGLPDFLTTHPSSAERLREAQGGR